MTKTKQIKSCENPDCRTSTGIHGGLTHGSGELDDYGYWEFPCRICAEETDKNMAKIIERIRSEVKRDNPKLNDEEINKFLHEQHEWLFCPAWPEKSDNG